MTINRNIAIGTVMAAMLFTILILFAFIQGTYQKAGASVPVSNGYQSTTTPTVADETNLCPHRDFAAGLASSTTGVLGSVVVTGPNLGEIILYDATTTDNTKRAPMATSSLIIAQFNGKTITGNASTTAATFTFDAVFKRGLLVDHTGANTPTTTITYRCGE